MTLYDACLTYGCFPNAWKKACVIALPKSPEKPRTDPASYRPISLLSVLGKILERMMVARLDRRVNDRMNQAPHGFCGGRSAERAW